MPRSPTPARRTPRPHQASVDEAEVARMSRIAASWWDPRGEFRPLHAMNPVRIGYIRDRTCRRLGRDARGPRPLAGLAVLDVGCGGGLLAEPMARLGARVTGIDAGAEAIAIARSHAQERGLAIDYRVGTAEGLVASGERFDLVLAMEVVEHVADVGAFLSALSGLARPGGAVALSTLNRTLRSYAVAIVGAEMILRLLPRGIHDWRRFLRPSELARGLRAAGLDLADVSGMVFDPRAMDWRLAPHDLAVNYLAFAEKRG